MLKTSIYSVFFFHHAAKIINEEQYSNLHRQLRDSVKQQFEFTIDTVWKCLREHLGQQHGMTFSLVSAWEVLKTALTVQIIKQQDFEIFEHRNLTSYTDNDLLEEEISDRIQKYYPLLVNISKLFNVPV